MKKTILLTALIISVLSINAQSIRIDSSGTITTTSAKLYGYLEYGTELFGVSDSWVNIDTTSSFNSSELITKYFGAFYASQILDTNITGLTQNTTYYFQFHADFMIEGSKSSGISSFTTESSSSVPTVTTDSTNNIDQTIATLYGNLVHKNGGTVSERGFCYSSTDTDPEVGDAGVTSIATTGTALGSFSKSLTSLSPSTTYYYKAYSTSDVGTGYGAALNFTTLGPTAPTLTTLSASAIFPDKATLGGNISSNGGDEITELGVCYSTTDNTPTIDEGATKDIFDGTIVQSGDFSEEISLPAEGTYYVSAYAINSIGTSYGEPVTFNTETQAYNISFTALTATSVTINWEVGSGTSTLIVMKESSAVSAYPENGTPYTKDNDLSDDFQGDFIATGEYVVWVGSGSSATISGLNTGSEYYFRAFTYESRTIDPTYFTSTSTNNPNTVQVVADEPASQAIDIAFTAIGEDQMTVSWDNGTGTSSLVLAHEASAVDANPSDLTAYTANTIFGDGDEIGTGNYVVYSGSDSVFTVTGLSPNTRYYFQVFEFNNTGSYSNYKIDGTSASNPNDTLTLAGAPTTQASVVNFDNINLTSYTVNWTRGNGDGVLVVAKQAETITETPTNFTNYSASTTFGGADSIATGVYVIYKGTDTTVNLSGLISGTQYAIRAYEYSNSETNPNFLTDEASQNPANQYTLSTQPSTQASEVTFSNMASTSLRVNWTNGDGNERIVLAKQDGTVDASPSDLSAYTANSAFGSGDEIGTGNYVVFSGSSSFADITGLTANTNYYFKVFEYNNTGAINYLTSGFDASNPNDTTTIKGEPTLQASSISFSNITDTSFVADWTRGDGDNVLIVAQQASTITATPTDFINYSADTVFGLGSEMTTGVYVVYKGSGTSCEISGLSTGTQYTLRAFEFNNENTESDFFTDAGTDNPLSQFTLDTEPETQASDIRFDDIFADSIQVSWTKGDGAKRIVLVHESFVVSANPVDGETYTANNSFGLGDEISPDNYVVYADTGNSFTLTNISPNTTYYFRVYEYNTNGGYNYLTDIASGNPNNETTLPGAPSTQVSNVSVSNKTANSFDISWTNGDGEGRIIAMREGTEGDLAQPQHLTYYTPSNDWDNKGDQLGSTGYYVVFNGVGETNSVSLSNLNDSTVYWIKAFEYNNYDPPKEKYNLNFTPVSDSTLKGEPTIQASALSYSDTTKTSVTVSCSAGNGDGRIVIINTENSFTNPIDGTDPSANSTYAGSGEQIVYNGTGDTISVSGLTQNSTYWFRVYEYNNSGTYINFLTTTDNASSVITIGDATWQGDDGSSPTDWGTAANWDTDEVPGSNIAITIPNSAGNMPVLNSTTTVNSITIANGAHLELGNSADLTINNNLTLEGSSDATPSGVLFIQGTGSYTVNGTTTYQRFMPVTNDWVLVSSPMQNATFADFYGYYGNRYDEANPTAWPHLSTNDALQTMEGIEIQKAETGAQLLSFTGTLNNGNQSISVACSGDDPQGWSLVGNPYPSAIDWDAASGWTRSNIDPTAYFYNASSNTYDVYNYNTDVGDSPYIAAMQGFFIFATSTTTLGVTNAVRVSNATNFRKSTKNETPNLKISIKGNNYSDKTTIAFHEEALNSFDKYDSRMAPKSLQINLLNSYRLDNINKLAYKFDSVPEIYSISETGEKLTIDTRVADICQGAKSEERIPLIVNTGIPGQYILELSETHNIPENLQIYLYDKQSKKYINFLKQKYNVYLQPESITGFELVIRTSAVSTSQDINKIDIYSFVEGNKLFVKSDIFSETNCMVQLLDITGRVMQVKSSDYNNMLQFHVNESGIYIVKVIYNNDIYTEKVFVK
jgi:hypothetical protein